MALLIIILAIYLSIKISSAKDSALEVLWWIKESIKPSNTNQNSENYWEQTTKTYSIFHEPKEEFTEEELEMIKNYSNEYSEYDADTDELNYN